MVLLVQRICHSLKLSSKLENQNHHHRNHRHHHHQSEALTASLRAFRSDVSNYINQLSSDSKPRPEFLSLSWIHRCLELLPNVNRAFAKLVMDIDYPMSKWEVPCMEEYLRFSLKLLDRLNSISSRLSHLGQARLSMSHALSLVQTSPSVAVERLRGNQFKNLGKALKLEEDKEEGEERPFPGEEWAVHQALIIMKSVGYWVCGIVLSGLSGDGEPYSKMKKPAGELLGSLIMAVDWGFCEAVTGKKWELKEVKEVEDAAACLVEAMGTGEGGGAAKQLERKLEAVQELLDAVGKEADGVFSEILAARNELIDSLRQKKQ